MRNPPKKILCSFCNKPPDDVVIRSTIGGEPPVICGECVLGYAQTIAERAASFEGTGPRP